MKRMLLFIAAILVSFYGMSQDFEGQITYSIKYENLPPEAQSQAAMLANESKVYIKGDKIRFEQQTGMASTVMISDQAANTMTVLMDAMGQKFKVTLSEEELQASIAQQGTPNINYIDGTKDILGFSCKKAEVTLDGLPDPIIFYYTEDLPPIKISGMESINLKGMHLAMETKTQGISVISTATNIDRGAVSDSVFEIPSGYTEMDDSMKAMMGIK